MSQLLLYTKYLWKGCPDERRLFCHFREYRGKNYIVILMKISQMMYSKREKMESIEIVLEDIEFVL